MRRFGKRLVNAKEKVVFALMVIVLIWRVVQIIKPPDPVDILPPKKALPVELDAQEAFKSSQSDLASFASIANKIWSLPGQNVISTGDEQDEGIPEIRLDGIQPIGTTPYARISVDGKSPQMIRRGSYFARKQAILDEIDTEAKRIVFRWILTGKRYEREIAE